MLIFGALHLVALMFGGLLLTMFIRSDAQPGYRPPEDEEGDGGGGEPRPTAPIEPAPGGGIPLENAESPRLRLREGGRLADRYARPARRPEHAPQPARRVPSER